MHKIYNNLPSSVKEDVGFPINFMSLTKEQEIFLDRLLFETLTDTLSEVKTSVNQFKDELEGIIEDL